MSHSERTTLLVGDNPFHGISHLSQERSRARDRRIDSVDYAAELVRISCENGADGFMFTVSDTTLSIIEALRESGTIRNMELYAIVPYSYEYVRIATQTGGVSGLAKKIGKQIALSGNVRGILMGLKGIVFTDLGAILKTYVTYEVSRIKSAAGNETRLNSILLHEVVTEMALAYGLDWLFKGYIDFMINMGINPGFETRNFAYLVHKFKEWHIDFRDCVIATPFNKAGFQMNPSKTECEEALVSIADSKVVAMSVLAGGYIKPVDAFEYLRSLSNISGVVVGVSKESQARETFGLIREAYSTR
jgi:hypothetical protein